MTNQPASHDNNSGDERKHAGENATALLGFVAHLLEGGITLIVPSLRRLPSAAAASDSIEIEVDELMEPLRVLRPHVVRGARRLLSRIGIVLILTIGVLLLPTPAGLSPEGHRALALFVFTGSILALEPVSLPIAALMVPVAQVALATGDVNQAFEPFSRPTVFRILSSLFLAEALRKHGVTRRLALATVVFSGGGVSMVLLGMMGVAAFFSMWVENTATTAVLIPVALTISRQVPDPKKAGPFLVLLVLGIAYSASLGGMATIMGSAATAVAVDFLNQVQTFTFIDWMKYGFPALILIFPITWWLLVRLVKVDVERLDIEPSRRELNKQGPMSPTERQLVGTMAVAIFFLVTSSFIEKSLGLPKTLLSSAIVVVTAVGYLSVRRVIDWDDVKGVSWGVFLIIGAGLSLGETLSRTGAIDWFATLITPLVSGPPLVLSLLALVYLSALLTNLLNNTTIAAVFVPILISIAMADPAYSATQLVLPVTLATTFGYSLPSASGRMALVSATGIVSRPAMMRCGLIMTLVSSGILALFFYGLTVLGWI
jgi:sodium-dependent dicarboxylate transporter 2/3/5